MDATPESSGGLKAPGQGRYNLRPRPLMERKFLRFLNEFRFPHLAQTFAELTPDEFWDDEDSPYASDSSHPLSSHPPSPNPSEVSSIQPPLDLDEVDMFGLEAIPPEPSPGPSESTSDPEASTNAPASSSLDPSPSLPGLSAEGTEQQPQQRDENGAPLRVVRLSLKHVGLSPYPGFRAPSLGPRRSARIRRARRCNGGSKKRKGGWA